MRNHVTCGGYSMKDPLDDGEEAITLQFGLDEMYVRWKGLGTDVSCDKKAYPSGSRQRRCRKLTEQKSVNDFL